MSCALYDIYSVVGCICIFGKDFIVQNAVLLGFFKKWKTCVCLLSITHCYIYHPFWHVKDNLALQDVSLHFESIGNIFLLFILSIYYFSFIPPFFGSPPRPSRRLFKNSKRRLLLRLSVTNSKGREKEVQLNQRGSEFHMGAEHLRLRSLAGGIECKNLWC